MSSDLQQNTVTAKAQWRRRKERRLLFQAEKHIPTAICHSNRKINNCLKTVHDRSASWSRGPQLPCDRFWSADGEMGLEINFEDTSLFLSILLYLSDITHNHLWACFSPLQLLLGWLVLFHLATKYLHSLVLPSSFNALSGKTHPCPELPMSFTSQWPTHNSSSVLSLSSWPTHPA